MDRSSRAGFVADWGRPGVRYMLLSAFAFSVMSLLVKAVGERLPAQEIVFARALVTLFLSFAMLRHRGIPIWGERRGLLLLRGGLGFLGLTCFYYALTVLPLADATLIQYLHPLFTALLAAALLGERAGGALALALLLSLVGMLFVVQPDALFGPGDRELPLFPVVVALAGALFSAAAYVMVRYLGRSEHPLVIVFYFPLVAVPLSLPALAFDFVWPVGIEWLLLGGVGLATQLGQVSLTWGLQSEPAGRATAISYFQVVLAAGWGVLFFAEVPDAWTLAGALLILLGTVAAVRSGARTKG
ncbi:MAG: DMT family transporter [Myxococcota bacterium]